MPEAVDTPKGGYYHNNARFAYISPQEVRYSSAPQPSQQVYGAPAQQVYASAPHAKPVYASAADLKPMYVHAAHPQQVYASAQQMYYGGGAEYMAPPAVRGVSSGGGCNGRESAYVHLPQFNGAAPCPSSQKQGVWGEGTAHFFEDSESAYEAGRGAMAVGERVYVDVKNVFGSDTSRSLFRKMSDLFGSVVEAGTQRFGVR